MSSFIVQLDVITAANAPGTCSSKVLIALDEAAAVVDGWLWGWVDVSVNL